MREDALLIGTAGLVWAVLALLYGLVPMFNMPGGALVWGAGAALFLGLGLLVAFARPRRPPDQSA